MHLFRGLSRTLAQASVDSFALTRLRSLVWLKS